MTESQTLPGFARAACYALISERAAEQLKIRILDTLGVAIGARDNGTPRAAATTAASGTGARTVLAGDDGSTLESPFYDIEPSQRFDFGDIYFAPHRMCHPSDAIGTVLHAADGGNASGSDFLTAVAVAYQVQTRLSDLAPGATDGPGDASPRACARAAAEAVLRFHGAPIATHATRDRVITPDPSPAAVAGDASGAGTQSSSGNASARPGSPVDGHTPVAVPSSAQAADPATESAIVAPSSVDWSKEDLESVLNTMTRVHYGPAWAQPSIDAALTLATPPVFPGNRVRAIRVKTFQAAYVAFGGGDGIDQSSVSTPWHAVRSLPYIVAVALLDRQVQREQYRLERILKPDVQALLHKVSIAPDDAFTARFPEGMPAQIDAELADGTRYCTTASSFRGSTLRPLDWWGVCEKFYSLATPFIDDVTAERITRCVHELDSRRVRDLTTLLAKVAPHRWRDPTVRIA